MIATCDSSRVLRRFAALFYDLLLLSGVLFVAFVPYTLVRGAEAGGGYDPLATLYLLTIAYLYFVWPWARSGQTLGMMTWKIRIVSLDGSGLDWYRASRRFLMALISVASFGLGYAWAIRDRDCLTWHDRFAGTRLIRTDE
jgi:uncharacterized RDD family membrane protein YckC